MSRLTMMDDSYSSLLGHDHPHGKWVFILDLEGRIYRQEHFGDRTLTKEQNIVNGLTAFSEYVARYQERTEGHEF